MVVWRSVFVLSGLAFPLNSVVCGVPGFMLTSGRDVLIPDSECCGLVLKLAVGI